MFIYTDQATENLEVAKIIQYCENSSIDGVLLGESNFRAISGVENGVGIAFLIDILTKKTPKSPHNNTILLDNVQDPGNMGAILRTAAAAGVTEVFSSSGSVSAWSPKVLRSGMGAHFALNIYENIDIADVIKSSRVPVLATSLNADRTIYQQDLSGPNAWIFGNEGNGVSDELLSLDVIKVIIPQNKKVESLNVAASVAVCLFEQSRQHLFKE
jgi:TrmH family RNA methyltransferase